MDKIVEPDQQTKSQDTRERLARECLKLDPLEEKALAEVDMASTFEIWPEY
jgi:hypothetical protein